jgi:hypothetical protein
MCVVETINNDEWAFGVLSQKEMDGHLLSPEERVRLKELRVKFSLKAVEVSKEKFPYLWEMNQNDPERVAKMIVGIAEGDEGLFEAAMAQLENDFTWDQPNRPTGSSYKECMWIELKDFFCAIRCLSNLSESERQDVVNKIKAECRDSEVDS